MRHHSAVGRRLGIADDDIEKLINLDRDQFEYREWLALKYAQDTVFLNGGEPVGEYMSDFKSSYSLKERKYILKLIRMMQFANYWNNTFSGRPWRAELKGDAGESCRI